MLLPVRHKWLLSSKVQTFVACLEQRSDLPAYDSAMFSILENRVIIFQTLVLNPKSCKGEGL